jgi:uncharacterized Zn-finger protein
MTPGVEIHSGQSQDSSSLAITMYCCMYSACGKGYSTKFNLKRHIETSHLKIKKYRCHDCDKQFASKQNLNEHMHIHSGAKPFFCKICSKTFRQASQLSLHKRTHLISSKQEASGSSEIEANSQEKPFELIPFPLQSKLEAKFMYFSSNLDILKLPKLRETNKSEPSMASLPSIF